MYTSTKLEYIYYKLNNIYFKVPTYGKIFKIIDFGRAIITYNNKVYMNDVYSKQKKLSNKKKNILCTNQVVK